MRKSPLVLTVLFPLQFKTSNLHLLGPGCQTCSQVVRYGIKARTENTSVIDQSSTSYCPFLSLDTVMITLISIQRRQVQGFPRFQMQRWGLLSRSQWENRRESWSRTRGKWDPSCQLQMRRNSLGSSGTKQEPPRLKQQFPVSLSTMKWVSHSHGLRRSLTRTKLLL